MEKRVSALENSEEEDSKESESKEDSEESKENSESKEDEESKSEVSELKRKVQELEKKSLASGQENQSKPVDGSVSRMLGNRQSSGEDKLAQVLLKNANGY